MNTVDVIEGREDRTVSKPDFTGFADAILTVFFDAGSLDAFDIQELAVERGLLIKTSATEACGGHCVCAEEADFPCECYRKSY